MLLVAARPQTLWFAVAFWTPLQQSRQDVITLISAVIQLRSKDSIKLDVSEG